MGALHPARRPESFIWANDQVKPVSQLTAEWIFRNIREFHLPHIKSTHLTNSTILGKDGWPEWLARRIDSLVASSLNGCYISA
jgi:hypothetical protein